MNTSSSSDEALKGSSVQESSTSLVSASSAHQPERHSEGRTLDTQWCREALKVYREVLESHKGPPSSNKRCNLIDINWMKLFVKFGAYLDQRTMDLFSTEVRF